MEINVENDKNVFEKHSFKKVRISEMSSSLRMLLAVIVVL